jgi:hypothetical protein
VALVIGFPSSVFGHIMDLVSYSFCIWARHMKNQSNISTFNDFASRRLVFPCFLTCTPKSFCTIFIPTLRTGNLVDTFETLTTLTWRDNSVVYGWRCLDMFWRTRHARMKSHGEAEDGRMEVEREVDGRWKG